MNTIESEASPALEPHVARVLETMRIPDCGLLVWLDAETGADLLAGRGNPFKLHGLFWPVERGNPLIPEKVRHRVTADKNEYVVWTAKEEATGPRVGLTVILAHELRHLEHRLFDANLYYAGSLILPYLLWRMLNGNLRSVLEDPFEDDAHARAREIAELIHGDEETRAHYRGVRWYRFLNRRPVPPLGELALQIRTFLEREREDIRKLLRDVGPSGTEARGLFERVDWRAFGLPEFAALA
jgi:hypothetical protein